MQVTHAEGLASSSNNPALPVSKTVWNDPHVIVGAPLSQDITVTNAELLALAGAPKQLVAAPGASKLVMPTLVVALFRYGSNHFSTDDSDPTVGYGSAGWNPFNGSIHVANEFEDAITIFDLSTSPVSPSPSAEMLDKALVLAAVGTLSGGVGCSLEVHVEYVIVDWS